LIGLATLALVTLKIKFGWMNHKIDARIYTRQLSRMERNVIENTIEEVRLLN